MSIMPAGDRWQGCLARYRLCRAPVADHQVYLRAWAGVSEARAAIGRFPGFENTRRPHSSLDGKTPDQADFNQPMPKAVAA